MSMEIIDRDKETIALEGGIPVRATGLPYGHQYVDDEDIEAVTQVLRSDWITTGPGRQSRLIGGLAAALGMENPSRLRLGQETARSVALGSPTECD